MHVSEVTNPSSSGSLGLSHWKPSLPATIDKLDPCDPSQLLVEFSCAIKSPPIFGKLYEPPSIHMLSTCPETDLSRSNKVKVNTGRRTFTPIDLVYSNSKWKVVSPPISKFIMPN